MNKNGLLGSKAIVDDIIRYLTHSQMITRIVDPQGDWLLSQKVKWRFSDSSNCYVIEGLLIICSIILAKIIVILWFSFSDQSGSSMMLDLHIEGAAPVTLLVRDESRSTRSTSVNKEDDLDPLLDFQDASFSSAASPPMHDKGKQRLLCSNRNRLP